jgi:DNA-binding CsgD family transcriptional regulator
MMRLLTEQSGSAPFRRAQLHLLDAIPGLIACVRDESLGLVWCNRGHARHVFGVETMPEGARGGRLQDVLPPEAARERELIQLGVMEQGETAVHYQLSGDRRLLCVVSPLDESSFGHRGIAAMVGPATSSSLPVDPSIPTMRTPAMPDRLTRLSRRELEVLYLSGRGMSAPEIARRVFRAGKTIEHHIQSIHAKLGFHHRGDLVRFCVERGLHLFSWEDWEAMTVHLATAHQHEEEG